MKKLTFAAVAAMLTVGAAYAEVPIDAQKSICAKKEWVWVDTSKTCVPKNPCTDTSGQFGSYCNLMFSELGVKNIETAEKIAMLYRRKADPNEGIASFKQVDDFDFAYTSVQGDYMVFRFGFSGLVEEDNNTLGVANAICLIYGGAPSGFTDPFVCVGIPAKGCFSTNLLGATYDAATQKCTWAFGGNVKPDFI